MDTIQLLGSTLGLGFVAGIRLYATVLALGLAIRLGWFHPSASLEHLRILAQPVVLLPAAVAFVIEFVSDKIPWLDSVWDSFHTFIRPIGAAVLAGLALGPLDPGLKIALIILCGGIAATSHSSKAATRLFVNHSPEPFSNIGLSLIEDFSAPLGIWLAFQHPLVTLTLVLVFLIAFAWASPKVFRLIRVQLAALRAWMIKQPRVSRDPVPTYDTAPELANAISFINRNAKPLPDARARSLSGPTGIRCAASKNIKGLHNSIGYLVIDDKEIAFIARRMFRFRVYRMKIGEIQDAEVRRGVLMHNLILRTASGESTFYIFKDVDIGESAPKERAVRPVGFEPTIKGL